MSSSGNSRLLSNPYRLSDDVEPFDTDTSLKIWKKVALAVLLLTAGCVLLSVGVGLYVQGKENVLPCIIIGSICFIPGFYHTRIAFLAWKGYRGYSFNSIPDI